jgi:signal transduction histidine kinase
MKRYLLSLSLVFCVILFAMPASATGDRGTAEEAIALVHKGIAYIKAHGAEKAYAAINEPKGQFYDRDLYLFVFDSSGKDVAHGANPRLIGKNMLELKDMDDKYFVKEFYDVINKKGKGWIDYKWPNPITKKIEQKSTYVEKLDDGSLIGCGIYK